MEVLMFVGVDYYPEHWSLERWETDARLMKEAGFNVVRILEFAWAKMEPQEGSFDFGWADMALGVLAQNGISAIIGTPTCSMPAWAKQKYPETLAMDKNGRRIEWGVRANYCSSSGTYRLLSSRITEAMAQHFKDTANVIGWQTHNEFDAHQCYCESCRSEFHAWLRKKYSTLDELNRAWGTHFWCHCISDWSQIPLPVDFKTHNPGLCLDWKRFVSHLDVRFQAEQIEIIRRACPNHFVTHNCMGLFKELNYFDLAQDLDFVSWDNYPIDGVAPGTHPVWSSMAADLMRGLKNKNFWIMEQSAGPHGWGTYGRNLRPGELRKIAYHQLAHGADGMIWFRWRSCTAGREQYWHGLLGHDGKPLRRYQEAAKTASEFHRISSKLKGTVTLSSVAIIYDYESLWAAQIQPGYACNDYVSKIARYYAALKRAGIDVDMIPPSADKLEKYKVILAPGLYVMPDALARKLDGYVRNGGVLICDGRTGVKDSSSLCHERTLPGLLSDALGISIEEYEAVSDKFSYPVSGTESLPGNYAAISYCDWVKPVTAEKLASYQDWHLQDYAAATRNRCGKGWGFYLGCETREDSYYDAFIACVLNTAGLKALDLPSGVEVSIRASESCRLMFLINHSEETLKIAVPVGARELVSGLIPKGQIELSRYEVAVLEL